MLHVLAGKVLVYVIITGRIPAIAACFEFGPAVAYRFKLNKNSQFARSFRPEKRSSGTIILIFFKNSVTAGPAGPAVTANMRTKKNFYSRHIYLCRLTEAVDNSVKFRYVTGKVLHACIRKA